MRVEKNDVIGIMVLSVGSTNLTLSVGDTFTATVGYAKKSTIHFSINNPELRFSMRNGKLKRVRKNPYGANVYRMVVFADTTLAWERPLVAINKVAPC